MRVLRRHAQQGRPDGRSNRRLFGVAAWREAAVLYTDKELAAFALTDAVTRLGDRLAVSTRMDLPER